MGRIPSAKSAFSVGAEAGITELLRRAGDGSRGAEDELLARIYGDLRRIAQRQVQRRPVGPTTQATALAHEVYAELMRESPGTWGDRREFLAAYTRALHNRMVDRIRRRAARGQHVRFTGEAPASEGSLAGDEVVALREHLARLDRLQPRAAEVFRIHYLVGHTIPEIAETLALGHATVERDLRFARTWLHQRMRPD